MKQVPSAIAAFLLLTSAACAGTSGAPSTPSPRLGVSMTHTPYGSGSLSYPTSIYDPTLLNDPSMIEDQWRPNGFKAPAQMLPKRSRQT
jgi:hypothetical protein